MKLFFPLVAGLLMLVMAAPDVHAALDGAALYEQFCSPCHFPLANSTKRGRTVAEIQAAIATNSVMFQYAVLTPEEVQAIADALAPFDGAVLYDANCAACHGPLASSTKKGATGAQLVNAIKSVPEMQQLASLTPPELSAIIAVLTPPPPNGTALYVANCSGCHGPLTTSSKLGRSAAQIQAAIAAVPNMQHLSTLTSADLQAIAGVLARVAVPTDGPGLYNAYCSGCHGPLDKTAKPGRSAAMVQAAINAVGPMASLKTLSSAQVQLIADALWLALMPPDGVKLYGANCESCHGPLATSAKSGAKAQKIKSAIKKNAGGVMGSLQLSNRQIKAIAKALGKKGVGVTAQDSDCASCHPGGL